MGKTILILTILLFCGTAKAQCPQGDIILTTQQEVDDFATTYPGCTQVSDLTIEGTDITNLDGLSQLMRISDQYSGLTIQNCPNLTSIHGLGNVVFVGRLFIRNNDMLISLDGLQNISFVDSCIEIIGNQNLSDIQALDDFEFYVSDYILSTCSWWDGYDHQDYMLRVTHNPNLTECALKSFCNSFFNSEYNIFHNNGSSECNYWTLSQPCQTNYCIYNVILETQTDVDNFLMDYPCSDSILSQLIIGPETGTSDITDLSSLHQVTYVEGLVIRNNNLLTNLNGLEQIVMGGGQYLTLGSLEITNNDALLNLDGLTIDNVQFVTVTNNDVMTRLFTPDSCIDIHALTVADNALLDNITGLDCLDTLGGFLSISNNAILSSLEGSFDNLKAILIGGLHIIDNPVLTDLSGLESITFLGALNVQDNSALTSLSGLQGLQLIDSPAYIENNIKIQSNPQLVDCGYQGICNYLSGGFSHRIDNNAVGCNNSIEVVDACTLPCLLTTSVNDQPIPDGIYQGTDEVNSIGTVPVGGNVNFKAGQIIILDNNFVIESNADFSAEIEDCTGQ